MKANALTQEMQAMAVAAKNVSQPATGQQVSQEFGDMLSSAINHVNGLQKNIW